MEPRKLRLARGWSVPLTFLVLLYCDLGRGAAQDANGASLATARQFGREGLRALEEGDNARADGALSAAIEAHDAPTLRLARGRARRALGRMLAAKEDYAVGARWPESRSD